MKVFNCIQDWQTCRKAWGDRSVGFVPTMGALHDGHRSLVDRCVSENQHAVVSIFVNPTQFDQAGDLAAYPSELEQDLDILSACGVGAVLLPEKAMIYPDDYRYRITENGLSERFCGAHRPGHFDGVLTVVMKLLNIVRPRQAYFGEKDYQQLLLVRDMVSAFFMDVEIVACPTARAEDGLALSSRNQRLDPQQRAAAPFLHRILRTAESADHAGNLLIRAGFDLDYVEDFSGRRLAAARLGDVRLIDNIPLASTGREKNHDPA